MKTNRATQHRSGRPGRPRAQAQAAPRRTRTPSRGGCGESVISSPPASLGGSPGGSPGGSTRRLTLRGSPGGLPGGSPRGSPGDSTGSSPGGSPGDSQDGSPGVFPADSPGRSQEAHQVAHHKGAHQATHSRTNSTREINQVSPLKVRVPAKSTEAIHQSVISTINYKRVPTAFHTEYITTFAGRIFS